MKNKTLTKNMPNVKWKAIPPVNGDLIHKELYMGKMQKPVINKWALVRKFPSKNVE
jgi:hypothetical protein